MSGNRLIIFYLLSCVLIIFSCAREEVKNDPPLLESQHPKIGILIPNTGRINDLIKVVGENFGSVKENVKVYFANQEAEIVEFSDNLVVVKAPSLNEKVEVRIEVKEKVSNKVAFTYLKDVTIKDAIKVSDSEIWYVNSSYNGVYRSIPTGADFYYYSNLPAIPRVQEVPFPWGTENFSSSNGGYITDNVYIEPDKPWVLQLSISTPGQSDTQTGSPQYKTWYRTSQDNGKTFTPLKQVIIKGYTSMNPIEGVEIGRNGFNVDFTRPIVRATNGEIMIPIGLHPWDEENQKIYLPLSGAFMFQDAGVLVGHWLPDGSDVIWEFGKWLRIDYNKSTRGLSEPTIVEINEKGHFAMICRGSNLARLDLPCYAWVSFSNDYCRTWNDPVPLTYNDGKNLFVTTAHSTLFKSKVNGKTYWIGNLQSANPQASFPRYPLVIAEVDLSHFGLIKETVIEIDTRHSADGEQLQLSNFRILENGKIAEIIVVLTRRDGSASATRSSWYRIKFN